MFCTQCGTNVAGNSAFCTNCGARLAEAEKPTFPPNELDATPPFAGESPAAVTSPVAASRKKPDRRAAIGMAAGAVAVVAVVAAGAFFLTNQQSAREPEQGEELTNITAVTKEEAETQREPQEDAGASSSASEESDEAHSPDENKSAESQSDYILPESAMRAYAASELSDLSLWELYVARNEIYARHGRGFNNEDLKNYFESKSWYQQRYTPAEFESMASSLNDYERKNAELIRSIEESRNSSYLTVK